MFEWGHCTVFCEVRLRFRVRVRSCEVTKRVWPLPEALRCRVPLLYSPNLRGFSFELQSSRTDCCGRDHVSCSRDLSAFSVVCTASLPPLTSSVSLVVTDPCPRTDRHSDRRLMATRRVVRFSLLVTWILISAVSRYRSREIKSRSMMLMSIPAPLRSTAPSLLLGL